MNAFREKYSAENGQTLILVFIILIILMFATLFLFDLHQVIKTKIKSRTAVDTAALVGAEWQKHTLNAIGEINLIKATTALLSEEYVTGGTSADFLKVTDVNDAAQVQKAKEQLQQVSDAAASLTQIQVRLSFVGPILGMAASQQAAKNNGLPGNPDSTNVALMHLSQLSDDTQYGEEVLSQQIKGYEWRNPYIAMLTEVLETSKTIAVAPNVQFLGYPRLSSDGLISVDILRNETLYDAINGDVWCYVKDIIRMDYGPEGTKWWGDIELISDSSNFPEESEYCPVGVNYHSSGYNSAENAQAFYGDDGRGSSSAESLLDQAGRLTDADLLSNNYDGYDPDNHNDTDHKYNPLAKIEWAIFDAKQWYNYGDQQVQNWEQYLRSSMQEGLTYRSGAVFYATARVTNETVAGNWEKLADEKIDDDRYIADSFAWADKDTVSKSNPAARMRQAEYRMKKSSRRIHTTALAKPLGRFQTTDGYLPPHAAGMILPVFDKTSIIPAALSDNPGDSEMNNPYFMAFLKEYLPHLGSVNSLSEMEPWMDSHPHGAWFREYHEALKKLNDPEWRQKGIDWLETVAKTTTYIDENGKEVDKTYTNEDFCNYWPSGGSGPVTGPSVLH